MQNLLQIPNNISYRYSSTNYSFGSNKVLPKQGLLSEFEFADLKQYNLPEVGEYYCGPVSVASGIVTLVKRGFSLLDNPSELNLIKELGAYFKTDANGTTTNNMCNGLEAFIKPKGYQAIIKYQGFRPTEQKYKIAAIPDLNWIKAEMNKNNIVLLNLGVYKKSTHEGKNIYTRKYGHFVLATGINHNGLNVDPNYLTIHDPYDRVKGDHFIKTNKIDKGKFVHNPNDNETSLTNDANGFLEISPRFNYFASDEVAVINGVISLEVKKNNAPIVNLR